MSKLTHLDEAGHARMVDVSDKAETSRMARATATVQLTQATMDRLIKGNLKKGDALGVARVAGIMGAKKTSELIPLCHPLPITKVTIDLDPDQASNQIIAVAEWSRLTAVTVDGDRVILQSLHNKIRNNAPVVGVHTGTVSIKNSRDFDFQPVLAMIVEEQCLCAALSFVIASTRPDRIYTATVIFGLWMNFRIAIDLTCGGLEYLRSDAFGKSEHVDRTMNAGLGGLNRIVLIMDWGRRTGEVINLVNFKI